jgi:hypothetical protein
MIRCHPQHQRIELGRDRSDLVYSKTMFLPEMECRINGGMGRPAAWIRFEGKSCRKKHPFAAQIPLCTSEPRYLPVGELFAKAMVPFEDEGIACEPFAG